ncbi:MAG TPA: MOSC N-terminal beta barrel domain-containing protein [Nocardioidaceae bacterium]|nr:MOSC N-terminal beta barrel domain-containing protein [Nocardioidaceae bacterium]
MRIERIGFTPLKGARHRPHDAVQLAADGPVGDRVFCLVDPARGRVVRTVENPSLVRATASWDAGVLSVDLPGSTVEGAPTPTGEVLKCDYWGRSAAVEIVEGPWAEAFSDYLGYDVLLARSVNAGEVVYGASVTLLTTASMRLLSERVGREVDSASFRSTFLLDSDEEPHAEDSWVGRVVRLGDATVLVRGTVPRCAVVDIDPGTGLSAARVLKTLAGYRLVDQEVHFGVDAVVVEPGAVRVGDHADLERG